MKSKFSIAMFFSLFLMGISEGEPREITHEDIKDAMLSLVHMMRDNTEKLERHEARDRQTAEQIKKAMSLLTKRMSTVDGLKAYLVKLDERVTGIEQLITQRDESERIQIQKTAETLEDLESRLEGWATEIETKVVEGASRAMPKIPTPPADRSPEILLRIQATEAKLADELDKLRNSLNSSILNTTSVSNEEVLGNVLTELKDMAKQIKDASRVLGKLKEAVEAAEAAAATRAAEFTPKPNSSPLQEQNVKLALLQDLLHSILEQIRDLPRVSVLQTIHNETQMTLQNTGHAVEEAIVQGIKDIAFKITENKEDARNSMTLLRSDLASDAERIKQELQDLSKGQSVMVEMADHVLDTKKRLEYASKIMREVSELVMSQGLDINNTLNTRFDGISNDIMDNQNGALANLTVKMEQEMNQVWRQINVMYQQMTESAKALDKLHKQNEVYVNGTTSTMDGMESKVGEITKRMSEVDTNLNYLLGRLSLVTQEFNQIKQGLGAALDNIKASFKEVQSKANDLSNPGPHPVPQHYKELESRSESVVNIPSS